MITVLCFGCSHMQTSGMSSVILIYIVHATHPDMCLLTRDGLANCCKDIKRCSVSIVLVGHALEPTPSLQTE